MVSNCFSGFSYRTTIFTRMTHLLNAISLPIFQNKIKISPTVLTVSLAGHLQLFYKMSFACNDKHFSDNNKYNEGGIGRCKMDYAKEYLIKRSKYCERESFVMRHVGSSLQIIF